MQPHPPSMNPGPYQKPLPPTPVDPNRTTSTSNPSPTSASSASQNTSEISQVAKLLQELAKNTGNKENDGKKNSTGKVSSKNQSGKKKDQSSDYASIDETITSSHTSSNSSSEIDLSKAKANKDGFYILYCPNKEKNGKIKLPLSAPSSTRMKRKQIRGKGKAGSDDDDYMSQDEDSELPGSQDVTESDDSFEEADKNGKGGNLGKNQPIRRTVREVKKKSKQNNSLASTSGGIIRRRMSSVYREGYLSGLRGAVVAAVQDGSVPLRYRKSPSTGNLPETLEREDKADHHRSNRPSTKRINFSVRERRSARKKRQIHPEPILKSQRQRHHSQNHQHQQNYEPIYSNSEAALNSDLDSAYSGSNCSKLTEDRLYELKRGSCGGNAGGSSEVGAGNGVGVHPDFRNSYKQKQKNLMDVQKQLRRSVMYNHNEKHQPNNGGDHNEQVNANFINNNNTTAISVGLISPPLPFGETKPTHFVTRDDSSTKILIVPETHV